MLRTRSCRTAILLFALSSTMAAASVIGWVSSSGTGSVWSAPPIEIIVLWLGGRCTVIDEPGAMQTFLTNAYQKPSYPGDSSMAGASMELFNEYYAPECSFSRGPFEVSISPSRHGWRFAMPSWLPAMVFALLSLPAANRIRRCQLSARGGFEPVLANPSLVGEMPRHGKLKTIHTSAAGYSADPPAP